jgi:catechol 2,3-dioxygenase
MPIERVGHVVLRMRDLEAAKHFYGDILGMKIANEREDFAVFFRFNDYHHDIAVFKADEDAASLQDKQVGLAHVALVADSLDTVKAMHKRLKENDVPIVRVRDHDYTKSVYCQDPDGNEIEIYCEVPEAPWQSLDSVIRSKPLDLEQ